MAGFLIFTLPWYTRNIIEGQRITIPYAGKIFFVIQERYQTNNSSNRSWDKTQDADDFDSETADQSSQNNAENIQTGTEERIYDNKNDLSKPFWIWAPTHFVHNLMSSILILPTSLEMSSLKTKS